MSTKARTKDSLKALAKLTEVVDGEPGSSATRRCSCRSRSCCRGGRRRLDEMLRSIIRSYRRTLPRDRRTLLERFATSHAARKVVGVGSVGTRAWILLMLGRDERRPAVPPGEGGGDLRARAVPRHERVREPRPARRRGPAADAGRERHHARLAARRGHRRRRARLLRPPALGREGLRRRRGDGAEDAGDLRRDLRLDAGQGTRPLGRPVAIAGYLGSGDTFDRALGCSPRRTPTRTSATTRR